MSDMENHRFRNAPNPVVVNRVKQPTDYKKVNHTRRSRGYNFEYDLVNAFNNHHSGNWNARRLGDKAYDPNPIMIKQGDTVTWTNKDFGIHTVTESGESFSSDNLPPNEIYEHTFDSTGTFDYHCKVHPTMTGKVIVT